MRSGMFIPDPDLDFLPNPDLGSNKAPDPGSGSATLKTRYYVPTIRKLMSNPIPVFDRSLVKPTEMFKI
jgi:hypothetical protein